jgi:hypothetical protein
MKNSIKLTALTLLLGAGLFAANTVKADGPTAPSAKNEITFSSLPTLKGVEIKVESIEPAKAVVIVYDQEKNVIFKDAMPAYKTMEKGYILNQLENGDYTIEVISNKQSVKEDIHVYDENGSKMFIVTQS